MERVKRETERAEIQQETERDELKEREWGADVCDVMEITCKAKLLFSSSIELRLHFKLVHSVVNIFPIDLHDFFTHALDMILRAVSS